MNKYKKEIRSVDGQVFAKVFRADGERVGFNAYAPNFWECWFPSNKQLAKRLAAAHKWADECIEVCKKGEFIS